MNKAKNALPKGDYRQHLLDLEKISLEAKQTHINQEIEKLSVNRQVSKATAIIGAIGTLAMAQTVISSPLSPNEETEKSSMGAKLGLLTAILPPLTSLSTTAYYGVKSNVDSTFRWMVDTYLEVTEEMWIDQYVTEAAKGERKEKLVLEKATNVAARKLGIPAKDLSDRLEALINQLDEDKENELKNYISLCGIDTTKWNEQTRRLHLLTYLTM